MGSLKTREEKAQASAFTAEKPFEEGPAKKPESALGFFKAFWEQNREQAMKNYEDRWQAFAKKNGFDESDRRLQEQFTFVMVVYNTFKYEGSLGVRYKKGEEDLKGISQVDGPADEMKTRRNEQLFQDVLSGRTYTDKKDQFVTFGDCDELAFLIAQAVHHFSREVGLDVQATVEIGGDSHAITGFVLGGKKFCVDPSLKMNELPDVYKMPDLTRPDIEDAVLRAKWEKNQRDYVKYSLPILNEKVKAPIKAQPSAAAEEKIRGALQYSIEVAAYKQQHDSYELSRILNGSERNTEGFLCRFIQNYDGTPFDTRYEKEGIWGDEKFEQVVRAIAQKTGVEEEVIAEGLLKIPKGNRLEALYLLSTYRAVVKTSEDFVALSSLASDKKFNAAIASLEKAGLSKTIALNTLGALGVGVLQIKKDSEVFAQIAVLYAGSKKAREDAAQALYAKNPEELKGIGLPVTNALALALEKGVGKAQLLAAVEYAKTENFPKEMGSGERLMLALYKTCADAKVKVAVNNELERQWANLNEEQRSLRRKYIA